MRLELHPEARAEVRSAAPWYDERRTGLGDEFIAEVSGTLDRIGNAPESYPAWPGTQAVDPTYSSRTTNRIQPAEPFVNLVPTGAVWSTKPSFAVSIPRK